MKCRLIKLEQGRWFGRVQAIEIDTMGFLGEQRLRHHSNNTGRLAGLVGRGGWNIHGSGIPNVLSVSYSTYRI